MSIIACTIHQSMVFLELFHYRKGRLSAIPRGCHHPSDLSQHADYTAEQHEWMAQQGILFERAVQDNHVLIFFAWLFKDWFDQWPITDDRSDAAMEQLKVIITALSLPRSISQLSDHETRNSSVASNMVYDLQTRKIPSLKIPPPPQLIAHAQPDNPPSQSQMSCSKSSLNARDVFTPPPALDTAANLIRCINDMEVSLGFIKKRTIRHLVTIQGAMMNTWSYPAWKQNNGELIHVSMENLQQYMLEWELEGPNCFCPLMDPSSSLVQTILCQDDVDRQWSFVCTSDYCEYHGCDEDAPPIEDLDYHSTFYMHPAYKKRWEKKHGKCWHSLETVLSDIKEGIKAEMMSAKALDSVIPESDGEVGLKSLLVPRLDLTMKRRNSENTILTHKYMKGGLTALQLKERRQSPQAQEAGDNSVQPVGEDVTHECIPQLMRQELICTFTSPEAPMGFHETTLFCQTIPILRWRELWIYLTQKAEGVTSEQLAGLLVGCGGCTKYYRDGLIHYCI
ncbi:hypothetical protein IW261DRAFT_1419598 [Armillaria novae-zelandiae]|uniref:Uncharacterized protein n=1 Tax=Armillaria novae-zelandiae TaxID=153914 RepID=A0AA39UHV5_9AGAR|nr:hypothetical protein IW261DRAFT_1419598 [Armillaria novae-zelandiae]